MAKNDNCSYEAECEWKHRMDVYDDLYDACEAHDRPRNRWEDFQYCSVYNAQEWLQAEREKKFQNIPTPEYDRAWKAFKSFGLDALKNDEDLADSPYELKKKIWIEIFKENPNLVFVDWFNTAKVTIDKDFTVVFPCDDICDDIMSHKNRDKWWWCQKECRWIPRSDWFQRRIVRGPNTFHVDLLGAFTAMALSIWGCNVERDSEEEVKASDEDEPKHARVGTYLLSDEYLKEGGKERIEQLFNDTFDFNKTFNMNLKEIRASGDEFFTCQESHWSVTDSHYYYKNVKKFVTVAEILKHLAEERKYQFTRYDVYCKRRREEGYAMYYNSTLWKWQGEILAEIANRKMTRTEARIYVTKKFGDGKRDHFKIFEWAMGIQGKELPYRTERKEHNKQRESCLKRIEEIKQKLANGEKLTQVEKNFKSRHKELF